MKVAEILRALANLVDAVNPEPQPELAVVAIDAEQETSSEIDEIAKLAGVSQASTTPNEVVYPLSSAYPAGDDVHHSKNPADIRTNAPSMYPGFQAGVK
jgi:hypothetical protein